MSIFYRHIRPENPNKKRKEKTVTGIYNEEFSTLSFGVSVCSSNDHFKKKVGRQISEGRASKKPELVVQAKDYETALKHFHSYCNTLGGKQVDIKLK